MSAKSTKARFRRFDGHGNVRVNGHPGWQLVCSRCEAVSKVLNTHNSPNALIKRFTQLGWDVGAHKDVCPECQRKTVASRIPQAKQALADMLAPMVSRGLPLLGYVHDGFFRTVDDLRTYEELRTEFAKSPPRLHYINAP